MNPFPPSIWIYHYCHFEFFRKFVEIFAAQGAPPVSTTRVANGKIFKQKNFNYFGWPPLGKRVNIYINFCLQVHSKVPAAWYCPHYFWQICRRCRWHWWQFDPGVFDTCGKFATDIVDTPVANLPPVSTTQAELVAKFAAGVVDTGGKIATGVVDTGGAPWPANISVNFRKNLEWP